MALIDRSYFFGSLSLPIASTDPGASSFNVLMNQCEKKLLADLLGYELNKAFQAGLLVDPIADKWNDLLYGKEYTFENRLKKWDGFIMLGDGITATINNSGFVDIVVNRGTSYDPAADQSVATIPPAFVGSSFIFHKRGYGPLRSTEFTVVGNQLTLTGGKEFADEDTYFYQKEISVSISVEDGIIPQSPIANFVYYNWMKQNASFTTASGEKTIKNPIAVNSTPVAKMMEAWNEMADWNRKLVEFLRVNETVYPEFKDYYNDGCKWPEYVNHKNRFGL